MDINDVRLDKLISVIETYRRRLISSNGDSVEYIATGNEIEKIKAPCCHIIEARRGCGKTTFISKALSDENDVLQICVDCQKYSNVQPDTVILEVCETILERIVSFLNEETMKQYEKQYVFATKGVVGFFKKKFRKVDAEVVRHYNNYCSLKKSVGLLKKSVKDILEKPDEQVFNYVDSSDNSHSKVKKFSKSIHKEISVEADIEGEAILAELITKIQAISSYKRATENVYETIAESKRISKVDTNYSKTVKRSELIDNLKVCFAKLFAFIRREYGKRAVLFLDDFYQIEMVEQPRILQYFHGIYKESGSAFCFKAVAIPDSIKINYDGQKLFSKKDDFPTIVLNYDLTNIDNLAGKLVKILISIEKDIGITDADIRSLFTSGTLIYLVMASGGIPRDFMALFSDTLICARDKGDSQIYKADLYATISALKKEKDSDRDVDLIGFTNQSIDKALEVLENWVEENKTNVILYPADAYKRHEKLLKALVNLRYIHVINEHVTPEGRNMDTVGILLDMTLYATNGRLPNNFKMCEFWIKDKHSSELRRARGGNFKDEFVESLSCEQCGA